MSKQSICFSNSKNIDIKCIKAVGYYVLVLTAVMKKKKSDLFSNIDLESPPRDARICIDLT